MRRSEIFCALMKDILMADVPMNFGCNHDPRAQQRKWWVFFRDEDKRWLLLTCAKTGARGAVKDPSDEEWEISESSLDGAYPWIDNSRVTLILEGTK